MSVVRIALGAEADIVSGDELGSAKGDILDAISGHAYKGSAKFIDRRLYGSGVVPATGPLLIELYPVGPAVGRVWNLTQVIALQDDHTAVTGVSVSWYLGDSANVGLAQCVRPAMTVPSNYEFSKDVIWHDVNEQLFAIVYGGTAGVTFTLMARERDYRACDVIEQRI